MRKVLFIHNPKAGTGPKKLGEILKERLSRERFEFSVMDTEYPNHAAEMVKEWIHEYDTFYAIGGDGTVNEIGKNLVHTDKDLGIIPTGSGNGLALELGLRKWDKKSPLNFELEKRIVIDTFSVNNHTCLNVAGIGFDAKVAHDFTSYKTRGFFTYAISTIKSLFNYNGTEIDMEVDGKPIATKAFSVSFANSRQFGNNAFIAPQAELDDGLLDVAIIRPFPIFQAPMLVAGLFGKTLHRSPYYSMIRAKNIKVKCKGYTKWHIDGEAVHLDGIVSIQVNEKSLRLLVN